MERELLDFDDPERVTVGTVGPPGHRVFLLQARQVGQAVTVKVEKQQVAALSTYLGQLIAGLDAPERVPAEEEMALEEPLAPRWAVGAIGVSYEEETDRIVIVCSELVRDALAEERTGETGEDGAARENGKSAAEGEAGEDGAARENGKSAAEGEAGEASLLRLALSRRQASALSVCGRRIVESGRPPCPLCGYPLDPQGHTCPRKNGHRPPSP